MLSRTAKSRSKREKKRWSLKEGSPYEEFALVEALHNLVDQTASWKGLYVIAVSHWKIFGISTLTNSSSVTSTFKSCRWQIISCSRNPSDRGGWSKKWHTFGIWVSNPIRWIIVVIWFTYLLLSLNDVIITLLMASNVNKLCFFVHKNVMSSRWICILTSLTSVRPPCICMTLAHSVASSCSFQFTDDGVLSSLQLHEAW